MLVSLWYAFAEQSDSNAQQSTDNSQRSWSIKSAGQGRDRFASRDGRAKNRRATPLRAGPIEQSRMRLDRAGSLCTGDWLLTRDQVANAAGAVRTTDQNHQALPEIVSDRFNG